MNDSAELHRVQYEEVIIHSGKAPIVLSLWKNRVEDPCIVFIPGTATHPLFYEQFLGTLAEKGFNIIGVHPISHGKSPRIHKMFTFEDIVQNGKDAVSYARKHFNANVMVMGSSQGGVVAIALAGQDDRIRAVFPHNILIPQVSESIVVTRFPNSLQSKYKLLVNGIRYLAKIVPKLPIPVSLYLDLKKVSGDKGIIQQFYDDPIGFMSYPLYFISSLFNADLSSIQDGSIKCPVIVIAAKGDPLFPEGYTRTIYEMIQAPYKELMLLDENVHLIFNERIPQVLGSIVAKLRTISVSSEDLIN
ncbi:alpha/beta hydrolase [Paenibacillus typhae]|uniref:Lysophospholipase, alpha-beta hydrolase superfamily n=1 Tax=Paenibacillus typhae TaxID=1174501 RepID=A0A1G8F7R3_9BACL|nr:alpha/beta fold hydrolase [Paenibacillus typhae]SDH78194.1 Lysophospholipase, alpha-beta hydrolase superfamily [Paenibacillus typhae]